MGDFRSVDLSTWVNSIETVFWVWTQKTRTRREHVFAALLFRRTISEVRLGRRNLVSVENVGCTAELLAHGLGSNLVYIRTGIILSGVNQRIKSRADLP